MTIAPQDILTSQGKYSARATHPECTDKVKKNSKELAKRVSALLEDFFKQWLSSGFRTQDANRATVGAAKLSNHMKGLALDLLSLAHFLKKDFELNKEKSLLVKHDLYMEDPEYTKEWCHLQSVAPKSGNRVFIP